MKNRDAWLHTKGQSRFIDDMPYPEGLLYSAVLVSPLARGKIISIDTGKAKDSGGVQTILTAQDIPGENQIGGIIPDEPLLAEGEVHYIGQPVAAVIADSEEEAKAAVREIRLDLKPLIPVFDPRNAYAQGALIVPSRTFSLGDVEKAWQQCNLIVEGRVESGPQEHLYLETQGSIAYPGEKDRIKVISSTQSPSRVQKTIARVLGIPINDVEVEVKRLGGAFGGKEDQATPWACITALGASLLKKPVKLVLNRHEDMRMTGKRHPYSSDFKMGLKKDGKILCYEVSFFQNAGAYADLSPSILERTLFHTTNSYFVPNVKATGFCCRTNLPPNTAFRGFGAPQAMFVMEAAIVKAAEALCVEPSVIQKKNLLKNNDQFPYGMKVKNSRIRRCWNEVEALYSIESMKEKVEKFNKTHTLEKKGIYMMPVCFGISFTAIFLNQAGALVHVYTDGSVSVSTGAVEMGQGVNPKILQAASAVFSIDTERVRIESTNTTRVANSSPTAASTGADLNGKAAELACREILARLKKAAADKLSCSDPGKIEIRDEVVFLDGRKTGLEWDSLISTAYMKRINLSAQAYYTIPGIHFDKEKEKGEPFAYHAVGSAVTEVTLDCLRGIYEIDSVKIVHDFGTSLNPLIDRGQAEGGIVQGIGWLTVEELLYSDAGELLTEGFSNYKVPDIYFTPEQIEVYFLKGSKNPAGLFNSKAIGEPPFMYGIGAYYALYMAAKAFRPDISRESVISAPLTPERMLLTLYD